MLANILSKKIEFKPHGGFKKLSAQNRDFAWLLAWVGLALILAMLDHLLNFGTQTWTALIDLKA